MAYTAHPEPRTGTPDTGWHVVTALLAVAGIVAAAIGAWLEFGPDNGTLTLFNWTWNVADISELWAPFLMIGGGIVTALFMGVESTRDLEAENSRWLIGFEGLITLIGVAAVVVGIVLLF